MTTDWSVVDIPLDEVCVSGNNLSSTPPSPVMELSDVPGDVNTPQAEDMISDHNATEIMKDIPLRLSSESIDLTSSWSQTRLHSGSKQRVKGLSRLPSFRKRSHTAAANEKVEGSTSGISEDSLDTESSITVLFEDSDEDDDECEGVSTAVSESLAEFVSIPEVVIVYKGPSFGELFDTDLKTEEEDQHRSEPYVVRTHSTSGAEGFQSPVTSPKTSGKVLYYIILIVFLLVIVVTYVETQITSHLEIDYVKVGIASSTQI